LIGYKNEAVSLPISMSRRRTIIGVMGLRGLMMAYIRQFFLPRHRLALEIVALRQQLTVFKRKQLVPDSIISTGCFGSHYVVGIQVGPMSHSC
jgi:hypothetical protein